LKAATAKIGHNRPPEPIEKLPFTASDNADVRQSIEVIRHRLNETVQLKDLPAIRAGAKTIESKSILIREWLAKRVEKGGDAFADTLGKALAVGLTVLLFNLGEALRQAYEAIMKWIHALQSAF
jgi:hypothetical protein